MLYLNIASDLQSAVAISQKLIAKISNTCIYIVAARYLWLEFGLLQCIHTYMYILHVGVC